MATETEVDLTNEEHLAEFDRDMALQRLEVAPEDLTDFDIEAAVSRAELEERLQEIDADLEAELAAIEADGDDGEPAAFSAAEVPFDVARSCGSADDCVLHKGTIFRAGDHTASHGFTMSRSELAAVVRDFKPVKITHGHPGAPGPLDAVGLGEVRAVELSPDGNDLIGTVSLPRWLRETLKAARLRVSGSFDRATKRLIDVSLVTFPHFADAELKAAFSRSRPQTRPRTTMSDESDDQYARRVNAQYLGRDRIATADFSAGLAEETDEAYAMRVNASHAGGFRGGPAEPPATPPAAPMWMATAPMTATPTPAEDGAFLRRLAQAHGGARIAAAALQAELAAITGQAATLAQVFSINWPSALRPLGERSARLEAMRRSLESADDEGTIPYVPPTHLEVFEEAGRLVASVAIAKRVGPAALVDGARARWNFLHEDGARVAREVDAQFRPSSLADVDALRDRFHRASLGLSTSAAEKAAILAFLLDFPPALGRAVARAVEAVGGRASVERDLADLLLIEATGSTPDDDEEELAAVRGQLKAIGSSTGRAATALEARRDELEVTLEARRSGAREEATTRASGALASALAGEPEAVEALAAAVAAQPDAFAAGFAKALADVPTAALAEVGCAGLASAML